MDLEADRQGGTERNRVPKSSRQSILMVRQYWVRWKRNDLRVIFAGGHSEFVRRSSLQKNHYGFEPSQGKRSLNLLFFVSLDNDNHI